MQNLQLRYQILKTQNPHSIPIHPIRGKKKKPSKRFTKETAKKTGESERSVYTKNQISEGLSEKVKQIIFAETELENQKTKLLELAKLKDKPNLQFELARIIILTKCKISVEEALMIQKQATEKQIEIIERVKYQEKKSSVKDILKEIRAEEKQQEKQQIIEQGKENLLPEQIKLLEGNLFDVIDQIPDNSIDLLNTDPPYKVLSNDWDTFKSVEEFLEFTEKWLLVVIPKVKIIWKNLHFLLPSGISMNSIISWPNTTSLDLPSSKTSSGITGIIISPVTEENIATCMSLSFISMAKMPRNSTSQLIPTGKHSKMSGKLPCPNPILKKVNSTMLKNPLSCITELSKQDHWKVIQC